MWIPAWSAQLQFQSTLPRGERPATKVLFRSLYAFQSTLPRGERPNPRCFIKWKRLFQSTLPRGERHVYSWDARIFFDISIHAPARGATLIHNSCDVFLFNFNPRSREGSDATLRFLGCLYRKISIHAPARGATSFSPQYPILSPISIHAPARGATWRVWKPYGSAQDFNPRSREGSDWDRTCKSCQDRWISIHAPARGATKDACVQCVYSTISIHAPARGATQF